MTAYFPPTGLPAVRRDFGTVEPLGYFCGDTPPFAEQLVACRCSHAEREERIFDHSLMLIDLGAQLAPA